MCFSLGVRAAPPENLYPQVAKAYLMRANDEVVAAKHLDLRLPPASLTKVMMGMVVLDNYLPETIVTISPRAAAATGSRIGLRTGDKMRARDLLHAALIASANDACRALAEWRAGTESKFVALMNAKAAQWRLKHTRFTNACGHDATAHYSSVRDLALITDQAMRDPRFTAIVNIIDEQITTADKQRVFALTNRNALIGRYPGAIGVKSGYTPAAGKCLIAWAERGKTRALVILLGADDRWWDAVALLDKTFEHGRQPDQ